MDEMIDYLQKDIIMDYTGYKERSYSERIVRGDGSRIDICKPALEKMPQGSLQFTITHLRDLSEIIL